MILENYICSIVLIVLGIYTLLSRKNLIKAVIGMSIIGFGIKLLLLTIGYNIGGTAPIFTPGELKQNSLFVDPIPQALVLTLIVIGLCFTTMALSLIIKIYEGYGTIDGDKIRRIKE